MSDQDLLDSALMTKLDRLALAAHRRFSGLGKGERRSTRKGASLEFVDYRHYSAGDDPRQVDWNVFGRSGNLFVKLFEEEESLTAHVLLDISRSMDWGQPNKLDYGRRLSAALGYVVLRGPDRLVVAAIDEGLTHEIFGPASGRRQVGQMFSFLSRLRPGGKSDLASALRRHVERYRQPGIAIVISDLLSSTAEAGIQRLLAHRFEVAVIHLVAPQECTPSVDEGLRLVDRETNQVVEVYLDQRAVRQYQQRFLDWCTELQRFCSRHRVLYQRVDSAAPLEHTIFTMLQARGILR